MLVLLFSLCGICYTDGAVVANPGQSITRWRETDTVHPATALFILQKHLSKGHFGSPGCWSRPVLDVLDICRKNSTPIKRPMLPTKWFAKQHGAKVVWIFKPAVQVS